MALKHDLAQIRCIRAFASAGGLCCSRWRTVDCFPEVLTYRDGNRANGRLVEHKDGNIVFESDRFGRIVISDTDAQVISNPENHVIAEAPVAAPVKAGSGEIGLTPPPVPAARPSCWQRNVNPWKGTLSFALEAKQENVDRINILTEARIRRSWADDEVRFGARYKYTHEDKRTTTDLAKSDAYWRHDFSDFNQHFLRSTALNLNLTEPTKLAIFPSTTCCLSNLSVSASR